MSASQSTTDVDQTLNELGINISDLSSQPQTFKGITKKLIKLVHDVESAEATVQAPVLAEVEEEIDKIKSSVPEWVFKGVRDGDGRVATQSQTEEANGVLDELEDFINGAPTMESLMDIQYAMEQGNLMLQNQFYKLDKLEDYEYNLLTTRMTSQATHQGLTQLGIGMESALPDIGMFTETPSPVNYGMMKSALETKKEGLTKVLHVLGSTVLKLVFIVVADIFVLHVYHFLDYWFNHAISSVRTWNDRRKNNKKVNVKKLKTELSKSKDDTLDMTGGKTDYDANRAKEVSSLKEYFDLTKYTMEEISLAKLYEDTVKSQLKSSNLDDLYKAASPNNLSSLKTLWVTLQDVLGSVQTSIVETTKEMSTLTMIARADAPVVDPKKLEDSLLTVHAINSNFTKYDDVKTDIQQGFDIIADLSKIFKKGDVARFDTDVKACKANLVKLDAEFKAKQDSKELTPELRAHLARRIYLLRTASDYLTKNINLQIRFQKLALGHVKLFEKMGKEADTLEEIIDKMQDTDNPDAVNS